MPQAAKRANLKSLTAAMLRVLAGNIPVYLCWLRDDAARLLAVLAVVCRPAPDQDTDTRNFSFAYALLRPAIGRPR